MLANIDLTVFEYLGVFLPSPAVLPADVPPVGMLTLAAFSANLCLSILSPVINTLWDDFPALAGWVQLMLSAFLLSVAISYSISGSTSDRIGRKKVLLGSLIILIICGTGSLLLITIDTLIGFRSLQGVGATVYMAMGPVIGRDVYNYTVAACKLSIASIAQAIVKALVFALGGMIVEFLGWRGGMCTGGLVLSGLPSQMR